MSALNVFLDGRFAGRLTMSTSGAVEFSYDDEYRHDAQATPVSLSMPLTGLRHRNKVVEPFLAGLLPDNQDTLESMRVDNGLRSTHPFVLLSAVGRDAAGAVQILPEDEEPDDARATEDAFEPVSDDALDRRLVQLIRAPEDWNPRGATGRWSLAGAQPKVALYRAEDGQWGVPSPSTPTTHILKPATVVPELALNEHLSTAAARRMGMPVADTGLMRFPSAGYVFVTHRYDRYRVEGRTRRLHQEDLCQACAVHPRYKYQEDHPQVAPGVARIGQVLRSFDPSGRDRRRFFEALAFNHAIAGTDAHAKNYSVILRGAQVRLAPLYDLASHIPIPYESSRPLRLAMSIGREYRVDRIGTAQWAAAAGQLGLNLDWAQETVARFHAGTAAAYSDAATALAADLPDLEDRARRIAGLIREDHERRGWLD